MDTGKMGARARLLVVDDHPVVRQGLVHLLNSEPGLIVCGEAANACDAMTKIGSLKPDLTIVDISLRGTDGIELTNTILAQWPGMLILILSIHDAALYAESAMRAGAKGYLMKHEATEKLLGAVRLILDGGIFGAEC